MGLIILYWVLLIVMLFGVVGALVPALPGITLILGAILVWGMVTQFQGMAVSLVVTLVILLLSVLVDIAAGYWGVKKFGASSWSQFGCILGLVLGMLGLLPALPVGGPIIGLICGAMIGAFVGEFAYRRNLDLLPRLKTSAKVCLGILVGTLVGNIVQALLALMAVIIFIWTTWSTLPDLNTVSVDFHVPKLEQVQQFFKDEFQMITKVSENFHFKKVIVSGDREN